MNKLNSSNQIERNCYLNKNLNFINSFDFINNSLIIKGNLKANALLNQK